MSKTSRNLAGLKGPGRGTTRCRARHWNDEPVGRSTERTAGDLVLGALAKSRSSL